MIPPFDNPDVISGQGTVGLEIAADCRMSPPFWCRCPAAG